MGFFEWLSGKKQGPEAKKEGASDTPCLAAFVFNADTLPANYGSHAQGQLLRALSTAAVSKGGWSAYPSVMRCSDGDLFERSMMGETPALTVLRGWITRGAFRIDVSRLNATFLGHIRSGTSPGFIPYALAIGPMPLALALAAHDALQSHGGSHYVGMFTLDGSKDPRSLDSELHIPQHITIEAGRVKGAQATDDDVKEAGLQR